MTMKEYYEIYGDGDFHIVIGDGNVEDYWINTCLNEAKIRYEDAKKLSNYLLGMDEEKRFAEFKDLYVRTK